MKAIERRIVTAYIVSSDDKLLLGRKAPGSGAVYADCWHNPGGGVDPGETDLQALKREVLEETGIDISVARAQLIDDQGSGESTKIVSGEETLVKMQFNVYRISLSQPAEKVKVTESDDLINFQWFPLDQLDTVQLTPPAKQLLDRIGTGWLYEK